LNFPLKPVPRHITNFLACANYLKQIIDIQAARKINFPRQTSQSSLQLSKDGSFIKDEEKFPAE
jgi:hypothetical protein